MVYPPPNNLSETKSRIQSSIGLPTPHQVSQTFPNPVTIATSPTASLLLEALLAAGALGAVAGGFDETE